MLQNLLGRQLLANKHSRRYSFPAGTVTLTMNGCTRVIEMPRSHRIACRKPISIENTTMGLNSLVQNTNTGLGLKFFCGMVLWVRVAVPHIILSQELVVQKNPCDPSCSTRNTPPEPFKVFPSSSAGDS